MPTSLTTRSRALEDGTADLPPAAGTSSAAAGGLEACLAAAVDDGSLIAIAGAGAGPSRSAGRLTALRRSIERLAGRSRSTDRLAQFSLLLIEGLLLHAVTRAPEWNQGQDLPL